MDKIKKNLFEIDLRNNTLRIRSQHTKSPLLSNGIVIEPRTVNNKFYLAVMALITKRYRNDGSIVFLEVDDVLEDVVLYSHMLKRSIGNVRNMIDTMCRRSNAGFGVALQSTKFRVTDFQGRRLNDTTPGGDIVTNILRGLFKSAKRQRGGKIKIKVDLESCGILPNKEEIKIRWHSRAYITELQAKQLKLESNRKKLPADIAVKIFEQYQSQYLITLKKTLAECVQADSRRTLTIDDVVPLKLKILNNSWSAKEDNDQCPPIGQDDFIKAFTSRLAVVIGETGAGKTTMLRHLAWKACSKYRSSHNDPLPVYLDFKSSLFDQLIVILSHPGRDVFDKYAILDIIRRKTFIFFVDGFDDLDSDQRESCTELRELMNHATNSRFLISTRQTVRPHFPRHVLIKVMKPENPEDYIACHGVPKATAMQVIRTFRSANTIEILSTPMFLFFIALILIKNPYAEIPLAPGLLMQKVLNEYFLPEMLRKPEVIRQGFSVNTTDDIIGGLGHLAYHMIDRDKTFCRKEVIRSYARYFKNERFNDVAGFARKLYSVTRYQNFLEEKADGTYKFWHNLFRDYFAARHLEEHWNNKTYVYSAPHLMEWLKWDNPLSLLCGFGSATIQKECVSAAAAVDIDFALRLLRSTGGSPAATDIDLPIINMLAQLCLDGDLHTLGALIYLADIKTINATRCLMMLLQNQVITKARTSLASGNHQLPYKCQYLLDKLFKRSINEHGGNTRDKWIKKHDTNGYKFINDIGSGIIIREVGMALYDPFRRSPHLFDRIGKEFITRATIELLLQMPSCYVDKVRARELMKFIKDRKLAAHLSRIIAHAKGQGIHNTCDDSFQQIDRHGLDAFGWRIPDSPHFTFRTALAFAPLDRDTKHHLFNIMEKWRLPLKEVLLKNAELRERAKCFDAVNPFGARNIDPSLDSLQRLAVVSLHGNDMMQVVLFLLYLKDLFMVATLVFDEMSLQSFTSDILHCAEKIGTFLAKEKIFMIVRNIREFTQRRYSGIIHPLFHGTQARDPFLWCWYTPDFNKVVKGQNQAKSI